MGNLCRCSNVVHSMCYEKIDQPFLDINTKDDGAAQNCPFSIIDAPESICR